MYFASGLEKALRRRGCRKHNPSHRPSARWSVASCAKAFARRNHLRCMSISRSFSYSLDEAHSTHIGYTCVRLPSLTLSAATAIVTASTRRNICDHVALAVGFELLPPLAEKVPASRTAQARERGREPERTSETEGGGEGAHRRARSERDGEGRQGETPRIHSRRCPASASYSVISARRTTGSRKASTSPPGGSLMILSSRQDERSHPSG